MTDFVVSSEGDRVAYDLRGTGPAVIFVAGAGQTRASDTVTTATAEALASEGITTVMYDRLGRGESVVEGRIDLDREIRAIAALLEAAGGSAVLCGHSSGCSISLAAVVAGLPVTGLVLWEAPLGAENSGAREWADEIDRLVQAGDLEAALVHYMKDMPTEWLAAARSSPHFPAMVAQAPSQLADAQSLAWAESAPHGELFGDIHLPVEVLTGEQTLPIMETAAASLVAAIPGAVHKSVPGANHSWEVEPMVAELASFVAGLGTPPPSRA
jgi:pimeloyl-ACP methyl ester carboxylesterase